MCDYGVPVLAEPEGQAEKQVSQQQLSEMRQKKRTVLPWLLGLSLRLQSVRPGTKCRHQCAHLSLRPLVTWAALTNKAAKMGTSPGKGQFVAPENIVLPLDQTLGRSISVF